jgi:hypothetical protein
MMVSLWETSMLPLQQLESVGRMSSQVTWNVKFVKLYSIITISQFEYAATIAGNLAAKSIATFDDLEHSAIAVVADATQKSTAWANSLKSKLNTIPKFRLDCIFSKEWYFSLKRK